MTDRQVAHEERDDALAALLGPWLPGRRWFPVKGTEARISAIGGLTLTDPDGAAEVRLLLLRAEGAGTGAVLQVPLVLSGAGVDADDPALVGRLPDGTAVLDGAGRPEFERAWLAEADRPEGAQAAPASGLGTPKVLPGEQSNTSVILPGAGPDGSTAMLKVFRGLSDGDNPDVDVPRALAEVGWTHVPRPLAWLGAQWPDGDGTAHGHLGVLSAFVPGATDGFELACELARRGESFADLAQDLGAVVGQMHRALSEALPTDDATAAGEPPASDGSSGSPGPSDSPGRHAAEPDPGLSPAAGVVADGLAARFAWAVEAVPELEQHAEAVAALAERTRLLAEVPPRQRVHGDLHLGQVLRGDGTWYVLDFEGEPLVPVAQRTRPDLALRDAAGMLRSFDYAAAVGGAPGAWTEVARTAFLAGYSAETGDLDPATRAHLLRVLELDKALYEAVYEARNRPTWLAIPLRAVQRLIG
ncbi:maltokinase N-terminal cap-like domain-containing protein [Cellulomonas hominis]|uniref:maltokinase N-terminal cap-like domain-containing protein n=1 Tax=Cellulomonas hominis TaxID=156981 RepID=UPI001B8DF3B1|nr:phosphotransferase [Cellulomonas hominis]VTR76541.1 Maltokinase [Cellulomonas hominis]